MYKMYNTKTIEAGWTKAIYAVTNYLPEYEWIIQLTLKFDLQCSCAFITVFGGDTKQSLLKSTRVNYWNNAKQTCKSSALLCRWY